ncbi:MAG: PHP domain-containing protein [Planctomycetes bacterium]|nr:PHP domain-containing protein [Planctomycetota bacterium]
MLDHPYTNLAGGRWLRGNLHTHTTQSDGARSPQEVIDDYAGRGHGFLMLSDHDVYTSADTCARWDSRGMILIPGNEISAAGPHLLHVGADRRIDPHPLRQQVINDVLAARGFIIVNHPNWQERFDHCPLAAMREWVGYLGLEIYNGVIGRLHGSPYATNKWDMLLAEGRRLWGFANDDSHRDAADVGLGWNAAYVTDPTPAGVVDALRAGRFYASTGVDITAIDVDGTRIRIATGNARRIVALRETGRRFAVADDSSIEVEYPDDAAYVRFECWGDGERFAWTQPFHRRQA